MNIGIDIKKLLDRKFENYLIHPISGGATDAELYEIITSDKEHYILKRQFKTLKNDYLNYKWLDGRISVPKVIFYEYLAAPESLCISKLQGETLEYYISKVEAKEIIRRYATSLKWLHSVEIDKKALVQNIDARIARAKYNLEHGLIDISELQPENQSESLNTLFGNLLAAKPTNYELVFTHGDYCFDNIIFEHDNLSGFIDIGNGGVADKYQDIALAVRSIQDCYNDEFVRLFFKEYGLDIPDEDKIAFYTLLDEFF